MGTQALVKDEMAQKTTPVRLSAEAIRWGRIASGYLGESMAEYVSRIVEEKSKEDAARLHAEAMEETAKKSATQSAEKRRQITMASVFKVKGKSEYTLVYTDEHGKRRKKRGFTDKRETERLAKELEDRSRKIKNGLIDPKTEAYRGHEGRLLADHMEDFQRSIRGKGATAKYVHMVNQRARRMLDSAKMKRISDLSLSKALDAVQALRDAGLSQQSINHHIRAVKGFSRWLWSDGRAREHHLAHLATSSRGVRSPACSTTLESRGSRPGRPGRGSRP